MKTHRKMRYTAGPKVRMRNVAKQLVCNRVGEHVWLTDTPEDPPPGEPCECGRTFWPWPADAKAYDGMCVCGAYREDHPTEKCGRRWY